MLEGKTERIIPRGHHEQGHFEGPVEPAEGSVREQWGQLTNDDVDEIQGRSEQLVGKIQERYGIARDEAQREVESWQPESRPRR